MPALLGFIALIVIIFAAVVLVFALELFAEAFLEAVVVLGLGILVRCPRRVLFDGDEDADPLSPPPPVVVAVNVVVVDDDEDGYDDRFCLVFGLALPPLVVVVGAGYDDLLGLLVLVLWLLPLQRGVVKGKAFGRLDRLSTRRVNFVGLVGLGREAGEAVVLVVLIVVEAVGVVLIRLVGEDDLGRRVAEDTTNGRFSCFFVLFVGDEDLERVTEDGDCRGVNVILI